MCVTVYRVFDPKKRGTVGWLMNIGQMYRKKRRIVSGNDFSNILYYHFLLCLQTVYNSLKLL